MLSIITELNLMYIFRYHRLRFFTKKLVKKFNNSNEIQADC